MLRTAFTLVVLGSSTALAAPVDQTGTGGGPASTAKAPYTTSTGATVPRAGGAGPSETGSIGRTTPNERADDHIMRGICIGCAPK